MATKKKSETAVKEEIELKEVKEVKTVTVTAHYLNVRKEPSMKADVVNIVEKGTNLAVDEDLGDWIKVTGGYVKAAYVSA